MPSKKQYDLVQNDDYDTRIPLHPEEAFHHGIVFQAKVSLKNIQIVNRTMKILSKICCTFDPNIYYIL